MTGTKGRTRDERRWWRQRAGVLAIVAGLAVLMAACSSSSSPRPGPGAYVACMRKHGVTGAFASPPGRSMPTSLPTSGHGVQIPAKVSAALQACQSLAPRPGQGSGPG